MSLLTSHSRLLHALAAVTLLVLQTVTAHAEPFAWNKEVKVAPGGWSRMVKLHNGLWLCASTLFPGTNSLIQLSISADNARTWYKTIKVADPGRDLDNGQLLELPDGSILLAGRSVVDVHQPTTGRSYRLPVFVSKDRGNTWSLLSQVATSVDAPGHAPNAPSIGLWEPFLFLVPDGRVACAYSDETKSRDDVPFSQLIGEKVSDDNGVTWGQEIIVVAQPGGGSLRPGMPVLARIKNGGYGVTYEVVGSGNADVYFKTSTDGVNWPDGLGAAIPGQHSAPYLISLSSGRLVVTSNQNIYSYSDNFGVTWKRANVDPWPIGFLLCWPSIYQTGPKEIAAMVSSPDTAIRFGTLGR